MPVTSAIWRNPQHTDEPEGFDVHVVANLGASQSLSDLLWLETTLGNMTATDANKATPQKFKVRFDPEFNAVNAAADPVVHTTNGVSVAATTGIVTYTLGATPPADVLHNFVLRATITDETGAVFATHPAIRIHLHPSISRAWVTPNILTAHKTASGAAFTPVRFRVLAEFGDQTSGDITNNPAIRWTSGGSDLLVGSIDGTCIAKSTASGDIPVHVTLPASLGGTTIDGTVRVADPLTKTVSIKSIGKGGPALPRSTQLNILFLSEGFVTGQEAAFDAAVVAAMQAFESPRSFPLSRLHDTVAFWSGFVPSREAGSTVLYETYQESNSLWYEVVSPPWMAPPVRVPSLLDVLARALPVPADQAATLADQQARWRRLYGPFTGNVDQADADVHGRWQTMADRFLLDERDTAFGLRFGERPRYELGSPPRELSTSPLRMQRTQLDLLLNNLSPKGDWGTPGSPSYPFVVFLCAGSRFGGVREGGQSTLAFSVHDEVQIQAHQIGFTHEAVLDPYTPPRAVSIDAASTMVHELAHGLGVPAKYNFGLNDEYGEFPPARALTSQDEADVAQYPNTQTVKDVKGAGAALDGANIRWGKWHRIAKAAVINAALPATASGPFQIKHDGNAKGESFVKNETIRLRSRPLATAAPAAGPFQIVSVDNKNQITVKPVSGTVSLAGLGAGDVVFVPKKLSGQEVTLVAKAVADRITATNRPLSAPPPPAAYACKDEGSEPQDPQNLPAEGPTFKRPRYLPWIVGLYDGGSGFNCGVFHPAGRCLMRRRMRGAPVAARNAMYGLCPVCRYALVDNLDPRLHGAADGAYQTIWPEP